MNRAPTRSEPTFPSFPRCRPSLCALFTSVRTKRSPTAQLPSIGPRGAARGEGPGGNSRGVIFNRSAARQGAGFSRYLKSGFAARKKSRPRRGARVFPCVIGSARSLNRGPGLAKRKCRPAKRMSCLVEYRARRLPAFSLVASFLSPACGEHGRGERLGRRSCRAPGPRISWRILWI